MSNQTTISIYLKRDKHENGMSLQEYTDAIIAGTQPVLSQDAFAYQFGAVEDEMAVVESWATTNNLTVIESNKATSTIKVLGTFERFDSLFGITLKIATTEDGHEYQTHDGNVVIPSEIDDVVAMILGFDNEPIFTHNAVEFDPQIHTNDDPAIYPSKAAVTPVQVATAYNLPAGDGYGGCIGLLELTYSGYVAGYNSTDVTSSFTRIGLTAPTVVDVLVDGATRSTTSDGETMLDIYCAGGVAPRAKIAVYMTPNSGQGFYDAILSASTDTTNMPSSLGISWGTSTEGNGDYLNAAFQACVAVGVTCFVATGDAGANNLVAGYPGTNAYQIASGGTSLYLNNDNTWNNEAAWSGGGGGVSAIVALPSWQTGLTSTTITASASGTATTLPRRGVPDVSAPADPYTGYQFYVNSTLVQYGGTSAAAPWLAGMITRLTQLWGKRTSFANSLFYSNTQAFTDITLGNNRNGYTTGYTTTTGWDAATGLGSPKGAELYKLFHTGSTFPKQNYGFRPTAGPTYPRRTTVTR